MDGDAVVVAVADEGETAPAGQRARNSMPPLIAALCSRNSMPPLIAALCSRPLKPGKSRRRAMGRRAAAAAAGAGTSWPRAW